MVLRALCIRLSRSNSTSKTHARDIPTVLKKITLESGILVVNGILTNLRQTEERKEGTQDAKRRSDPERVLVAFDDVVACIGHEDWVEVVANESTDLAEGCGYCIVATSNSGSRSLGCDETDVVTRTDCENVSILLTVWVSVQKSYVHQATRRYHRPRRSHRCSLEWRASHSNQP